MDLARVDDAEVVHRHRVARPPVAVNAREVEAQADLVLVVCVLRQLLGRTRRVAVLLQE